MLKEFGTLAHEPWNRLLNLRPRACSYQIGQCLKNNHE